VIVTSIAVGVSAVYVNVPVPSVLSTKVHLASFSSPVAVSTGIVLVVQVAVMVAVP
jgi:hypothetical protein